MKFRKGIYRAAARRLSRGDLEWLFRRAAGYRRIRRALRRSDGRTSAGPVIVHLFSTARCDSRCPMCDIPGRTGGYEFTAGDFREMLDGVLRMGVGAAAFTGGEPTLRPDIHELLNLSQSAGLETILVTNGLTLDRHVEKIVELGIGTVNVSLDGVEASVHDAVRGVDGAFERTVANLRLLTGRIREKKGRTEVVISTVLQSANASSAHLDSFLRFLDGLGVSRVIFCPVHDFNRGEGKIEVGRVVTDCEIGGFLLRHPLRRLIDNSDGYLSRLDEVIKTCRPPAGCVAGYTTLFVDWEMKLYPCKAFLEIGKPLADLRRDRRSLPEIWHGEEFNEFRRYCPTCRLCFLTVNREFDRVFR